MDRSFTRRSVIKGALICGASAALGATFPNATFPTDPRDRIAVATYPFRKWIVSPGNDERDAKTKGMDLAAFARYIRSEFHVNGIEPLSGHFVSTEASEIRKLRAAFDAAGVRTVNIPVDESVELCSEDPAKRTAGNAAYRRWVDVAKMLGSPSIRVWIPKCSDRTDLPKAVHALMPTIDYAATQNIVVNLENDDPVNASVARSTTAIKLANTRWLRALPDFGNGLMGGDAHFNAAGLKEMFHYAYNIAHVKDAETVEGKRKTASLAELYGIAKAAGYKGYYSIESDSDADPLSETKRVIEQSLTLI